jgi:hypothetical protein
MGSVGQRTQRVRRFVLVCKESVGAVSERDRGLPIIENCAAAKQVLFFIPAEAGIQNFGPSGLDSRVRGNDEAAL